MQLDIIIKTLKIKNQIKEKQSVILNFYDNFKDLDYKPFSAFFNRRRLFCFVSK